MKATPPHRQVPTAVVLAVLTVGGRYALQLRDDRPNVASPGHWALFGGGIDGEETPKAAIRREILEELGLDVVHWQELWRVRYYVPFWNAEVLHFVFAADVTEKWSRHVLSEGQATGVFAIDDLPHPMQPIVMALLQRYDEQARRNSSPHRAGG